MLPEPLLGRPPQREGADVKCPQCGYGWKTLSSRETISCPKCHRPFTNVYSPARRLRCPHCHAKAGLKWDGTLFLRMAKYQCPACAQWALVGQDAHELEQARQAIARRR